MTTLAANHLRTVFAGHEPPCVSVYMMTDPHHPGGPADRQRLGRLLRTAAGKLAKLRPSADAHDFLAPLAAAFDTPRPPRAGTGLALLRSSGATMRYTIPAPVPELVVVTDTFHVKPLLRFLERGQFFVLAVSARSARLFQGAPAHLVEVKGAHLPAGVDEALGDRRIPEPYVAVHGRGAAIARRGHRETMGAHRERLARYFRILDGLVRPRLAGAPLVLAGVGVYHALYRAVTRCPNLLDVGVEGHVDRLGARALHRLAWPIVAEHEAHVEAEAAAQYVASIASGKTSDALEEIARAAVSGRVRVLLHREGWHIWGHLDRRSGACQLATTPDAAGTSDVIDDLCEETLLRGGDVVEIADARMPTTAPVAAVLRY